MLQRVEHRVVQRRLTGIRAMPGHPGAPRFGERAVAARAEVLAPEADETQDRLLIAVAIMVVASTGLELLSLLR